jgi:hypothetical protein
VVGALARWQLGFQKFVIESEWDFYGMDARAKPRQRMSSISVNTRPMVRAYDIIREKPDIEFSFPRSRFPIFPISSFSRTPTITQTDKRDPRGTAAISFTIYTLSRPTFGRPRSRQCTPSAFVSPSSPRLRPTRSATCLLASHLGSNLTRSMGSPRP